MDRRIHPPLRHLRLDQLFEPFDPLHGVIDREQIFLAHRLQRRQRHHDLTQVTPVRFGPVRLAGITVALAEEKRF